MERLICLALLWVVWLISPKRWRRRVVQPLAIVVLGLIIITSSGFVSLLVRGLTVALPPDPGEPVDTIVVLGRGDPLRPARITETWHLWEAQRAPTIFASGMLDAKFIVRDLEENGVPATALAGEECSQTTEENGLFTSALLRPQGVNRILLVTDPPHLWRAFLVFQSFGFQVVPHATTLELQQMPRTQQLTRLAREYVGLAHYALTQKLKPRSQAQLDTPAADVTRKITEWNCKIPR